MESQIQHSTFHQIWLRFNANLGALRTFSQNISFLADQQDQSRISAIAQQVAGLFGDDPEQVRSELLQFVSLSNELEFEPDLRKNPDVQEILGAMKSKEFQQNVQKWQRRNPAKARVLSDIIVSLWNEPIANGVLLRRSALVVLVSFYETLLVSLLKAYYGMLSQGITDSARPEGSDQVTLPKKTERIIAFGSISDRLALFDSLGINLQPLAQIKGIMIEIAERRNVFVHNDGIIDQRYLDHTSRTSDVALLGRQYLVPSTYLLAAIDATYFCGLTLLESCWREWTGGSHKQADRLFVDSLFTLLTQKRYDLVALLGEAIVHYKIRKKEGQLIIVNHAIALRELGKPDAARKLIEECRSSPASGIISFAVYVLQEDYDSACVLMTQMIRKGKIKDLVGARPLLIPVKNDPRFAPLLKNSRFPD